MLTVIAQSLFTSTGWVVFVGASVLLLVCSAIARWIQAGRQTRWWRFTSVVLSLTLLVNLLLFAHVRGEVWACVITLAVTCGAYLLLTKSGRSILRFEKRHAGRPTPVAHMRGRLTVYVVVTTFVILFFGLPLSFALVGLLESHAAGLVETLEAPIVTVVCSVLTFATLDCLWRWLEAPRARRL